MADSNITPVSDETKDLLDRFSNWLFARRDLAASSIELVIGYIRRMIAKIGASVGFRLDSFAHFRDTLQNLGY